jgi:hypothetical protein
MTSNASNGYTASNSTVQGTYSAYFAFDNSTKPWASATGAFPSAGGYVGNEYVQLTKDSGTINIRAFTLTAQVGFGNVNAMPKSWTLYGSNDAGTPTNWQAIHTKVDDTAWTYTDESREYDLGAEYNFKHIKFNVTKTNGNTYCAVNLGIISQLNFTSKSLTVRLPTGGLSSTDKDNEWDKFIVESTLGGKITAGDNQIWNWSTKRSWTNTTGTVNTYRCQRGGTNVGDLLNNNATYNVTTYTGVDYTGFRPVLLIQNLSTNTAPVLSGLTCTGSVHTENATLSGNITDDGQIQYRISLNGSYVYPDGAGTYTALSSSPVAVNYTVTNGSLNLGSNTVLIEVLDDGSLSSSQSFTVSKTQMAPSFSLSSLPTSRHTATITLSGTVSDPDSDTVDYEISWGVGASPSSWNVIRAYAGSYVASGTSINQNFTYATIGTDDIKVRVICKDSLGLEGTYWTSSLVTFTNSAPTNNLSLASSRHKETITLSGQLSDTDGDGIDYKISWGIGESPSSWTVVRDYAGSYSSSPVSISEPFTYATIGTNIVTVKVEYVDEIGVQGTTFSQTVTFTHSAPINSITNPLTAIPTTRHSDNVTITGKVSDADGDTIRYRVLLGDGSGNNYSQIQAWSSYGASPIDVACVVLNTQLGTVDKTIKIEFEDDTGDTGEWTQLITFSNTTPVLDISPNYLGICNNNFTITGQITEVVDADTVRYKVEINNQVYIGWTEYATSPVPINIVIPPSSLDLGINTVVLYADDGMGGTPNVSYTVIKRDWEITYVDSANPNINYFDATSVLLSNTKTVYVKTGDNDPNLGYPDVFELILKMLVQGTGTVTVAKITSAWTPETVTYNTKPTIDTAHEQTVTFTNTATQTIDTTLLANEYGVALYTTGDSFQLDYLNNYATITYKETALYQPDIVYYNTTVILWEPPIFADPDVKANAFYRLVLQRSEDSGFSTATTLFQTTDMTIKSFQDDSIEVGKTYFYRILMQFQDVADNGSKWDFDKADESLYVKQVNDKITFNVSGTAELTAGTVGTYYLTSGSGISMNTIDWEDISSVSITQTTTPDVTQIRYAFSNNGRQSWKVYSGGSWTLISLNNLLSQGMTEAQVEALTSEQWHSFIWDTLGTDKLDVAIVLDTISAEDSPSVDSIVVNYTQIPMNRVGDSITVLTPSDNLHRRVWNTYTGVYTQLVVEGLLFHDNVPEYYSTQKGIILKYLEMPLIYAGQESEPTAISLENTFSVSALNISLTADVTGLPSGCTILFSATSSPFTNSESLTISSLGANESTVFYIKLVTPQGAQGEGTFDIKVKGTVPTTPV